MMTVVERIRMFLEDASVDSKYDDQFLVDHVVYPAQADVHARLSLNPGTPVILKFSPDIADEASSYRLPPCVASVVRVVEGSGDSAIVHDIEPSEVVPGSRRTWRLEGHPGSMEIVFDGGKVPGSSFEVWYRSNGDVMSHLGEGILSVGPGGVHSIVLDQDPDLGRMDRRVGAYDGQTLRVIPDSGPVEEAIIASHRYEAPNYIVTLRRPLRSVVPGTIRYEISHAGSQAMADAIAAWGAMNLSIGRKISESHYQRLRVRYLSALKTVADGLVSAQGVIPTSFRRNEGDLWRFA